MSQAQGLSTPNASGASAAVMSTAIGKYLIFDLAGEEFGIQILKVREIIGLQDITFIPHTPACVKGVINLRGKVVPVVDLRLKFAMQEAEYTDRTCIIVVGVLVNNATVLTGVVVDSVSEVLNIAGSDIEDSPNFGDKSDVAYLHGMAKIKGKVKILLDIDEVLANHAVLPALH